MIAQRVAETAQVVLARVLAAVVLVGGFGLAVHLYLLSTPVPEPTAPAVTAALGTPRSLPRPDLGVIAALEPLEGRVLAGTHAFPVAGASDYAAVHHDYPATDLFAACGTPVLAAAAGVVTQASAQDVWDPATNVGADRGGHSVTLLGDDGVRYYGSHLAEVRAQPGQRVQVGQVLGTVGETGSAAGTGCHLHFGISPGQCGPGDWFTRRGAVPTYDLLAAWRMGQDADPVPAVQEWHRTHGCPTEPTVYP